MAVNSPSARISRNSHSSTCLLTAPSGYRTIGLSVGNWVGSPAPVVIAISHVALPNTPNANLITSIDTFTLAPGGSASKVYEVPGEVVLFLASPGHPQLGGIQIDFTIYSRTD